KQGVPAALGLRSVVRRDVLPFELIVALQVDPELGRRAEVPREPQRRVCGDPPLAVHNLVDPPGRDANRHSELVLCDAEALDEVLHEDLTRVNRLDPVSRSQRPAQPLVGLVLSPAIARRAYKDGTASSECGAVLSSDTAAVWPILKGSPGTVQRSSPNRIADVTADHQTAKAVIAAMSRGRRSSVVNSSGSARSASPPDAEPEPGSPRDGGFRGPARTERGRTAPGDVGPG